MTFQEEEPLKERWNRYYVHTRSRIYTIVSNLRWHEWRFFIETPLGTILWRQAMIGSQTTHEVCKGPSELGTAWSDILYSKHL